LSENPFNYGQAFNFGPNTNDALSVEEMVERVIENWGTGRYKSINDTNNPHEAGLLKLDISKAVKELNWMPIFNAQIAVERTINWYKLYYAGVSASELIKSDIEFYQKIKNNE
jgi:CDP-glucose 4,6-dehydratase